MIRKHGWPTLCTVPKVLICVSRLVSESAYLGLTVFSVKLLWFYVHLCWTFLLWLTSNNEGSDDKTQFIQQSQLKSVSTLQAKFKDLQYKVNSEIKKTESFCTFISFTSHLLTVEIQQRVTLYQTRFWSDQIKPVTHEQQLNLYICLFLEEWESFSI